jgi:hypothetical protein
MNNRFFIKMFCFVLVIFLPIVSFAALITCDGVDKKCDFDALISIVDGIIVWILSISVSVAALSFAYAGGMMLLFPTDPGKRKDAKEIFKKTIIGLLIILSAWLVITSVIKTLVGDSGDALRFLK